MRQEYNTERTQCAAWERKGAKLNAADARQIDMKQGFVVDPHTDAMPLLTAQRLANSRMELWYVIVEFYGGTLNNFMYIPNWIEMKRRDAQVAPSKKDYLTNGHRQSFGIFITLVL